MADKFTMRPLLLRDVFTMSKILKKMDLKMEVDDETSQIQMGVQFIQRLMENLHMAEKDVNSFLADLVGMTEDEFSELTLEDSMEIFELFKQQKGLANFLKLAGK